MIVDIHSHVIWGIDDGAKTQDQTFQMLRAAAEDGIRKIITTPHMTPGVFQFPDLKYLEHLEAARRFIAEEGLPLRLATGAEILYTDLTPRLLRERKVPTLDNTRCPLIEFSPADSWEHIRDALQKVSSAGFTPVIAHMERYPAVKSLDQVRRLKDSCCAMVQINARSLLRKQPLMRRRFFDKLFEDGYVDFIATDTHALPGRETCLKEGMEALRKKYGDDIADQITQKTYALFGGAE